MSYVLKIFEPPAGEVQAFVIEQATRLGLAVLDTQAGAAWFPGNVRLGRHAEGKQSAVAADKMPPCGEPALLLFDALGPVLASAGFKPARSARGRRPIPRRSRGMTGNTM